MPLLHETVANYQDLVAENPPAFFILCVTDFHLHTCVGASLDFFVILSDAVHIVHV